MLFDKVTKKHILQGITDFEEKGFPKEFGPSSTYDVVYEGKKYPPKAIMAYANYHAEGRTIERYFKGGEGTDCFKAFERNGFEIKKKKNNNMNIFFGKISGKFDTNQIEEGYYKSDKGSSWFGSIKIDDYAFIIGGDKIQFWRAREWGQKDGVECLWFDILNNDLEIKLNKFTALKFFKITTNLVVLSSRSARNKAFFKLETLTELDIDYLSDSQTYKNDELYRKIIIHKDKTFVKDKSEDLQFFYDNEKLKFFANDFTQQKIISNYRDNLAFGGGGAVRKDNVIKTLKSKKLNPSAIFKNDEISMRSIYDTLFCEYTKSNTSNSNKEIAATNKEEKGTMKKFALNKILYGPPGTGKTYKTISDAISIVNPNFDISQERPILKDEYNRLSKEGKIVFTTFHQSMSYEDFVEGIKPVLNQDHKNITYDIQDGIFKAISDKAKGIQGEIKTNKANVDFRNCNYFKMSVGGKNRKDVHNWCIANNQIALGYGGNNDLNLITSKDWKSYKKEFQEALPDIAEQSSYSITATHAFKYWMKRDDIVLISLGNHIIDAIGVIKGDYKYVESPEFPYHHIREVEWIATNLDANPSLFVDKKISQQTIYQFNNDDIKIDYLEGILSQKTSSDLTQNHVIIIDEINRGNISAIFGELITLLEEDKRRGNKEALSVILPYSQESFSVPKNLYIIGTMNTADRSVEALDTALRRRFEFKEMMPDYTVIEAEEVHEIRLSEVLKTINQRIELLIDRDHTIGHSYFVNVDTEKKLANAFNNKIVPLLQEYFYGDYGKIGLVLGKGFVDKKENKEISFADFKYDNSEDFKTPSYLLKPVDEASIIEAIEILLGKKESEVVN